MSDDKKRTKDALLNELESIKDLLGEDFDDDEVPLLTSHVEGEEDEDPPMLTEALNNVIDDIRHAALADDDIPTLEAEHEPYEEERYGDFDVEELDDLPEINSLSQSTTSSADRAAPPLASIEVADDDSDQDNDIVARALRSNSLQKSVHQSDNSSVDEEKDIDVLGLSDDEEIEDEFGIMIDDDDTFAIIDEKEIDDEQQFEDDQDVAALEDVQPPTAKLTSPSATSGAAALKTSAPARSKSPETHAEEEEKAASSLISSSKITEHQPSLFDTPKTSTARNATSTAPAAPSTSTIATAPNAASAPKTPLPTLGKTENPFLPKHIRDRLHTNRTLQQEIDATHTYNTTTATTAKAEANTSNVSAGSSDDRLVEQVLKTVLPKIEAELRQRIRELLHDERHLKKID